MDSGKRRRELRARRREKRKKMKLGMICILLVLCVAGVLRHQMNRPLKIVVKAKNQQMIQEGEKPALKASVEVQGQKENFFSYRKNRVKPLLQQLEEEKGYTLSCECDGIKEGKFPIEITLTDEMEKEIAAYKGKADVSFEAGKLLVKNKYGEWDKNRFKNLDGDYVKNAFIPYHGRTYYFDADGEKVTGWQDIENDKYYFNKKGVMQTGWLDTKGGRYYLEEDGKMAVGWKVIDDQKYYFSTKGKMATGEKKIGMKTCKFDADGRLLSETGGPDPNKPMLALTFDDGPGPKTMELLKTLQKYGARATFFMTGTSLQKKHFDVDATLKKMEELGCDTGNHSMTHPQLNKLSVDQIKQQIEGVNELIKGHLGHGAVSLRPPYGAGIRDPKVIENSHLPMIYWSVDTLDWKTKSKEATLNAILSQSKDGDIVLLHDIHDWSVDAAIEAIPQLINKGFQLVTVSELAEARGIQMKDGVTYFDFYPKK